MQSLEAIAQSLAAQVITAKIISKDKVSSSNNWLAR
jgi:hypothetical protein